MTDAGRAVLPDMYTNGFVIDSEILTALQADLFYSRLQLFIENTKKVLCTANGTITGDF